MKCEGWKDFSMVKKEYKATHRQKQSPVGDNEQ